MPSAAHAHAVGPPHASVMCMDIVLPATGQHMLTSEWSVDSDTPWRCEMRSVACSEIIESDD